MHPAAHTDQMCKERGLAKSCGCLKHEVAAPLCLQEVVDLALKPTATHKARDLCAFEHRPRVDIHIAQALVARGEECVVVPRDDQFGNHVAPSSDRPAIGASAKCF